MRVFCFLFAIGMLTAAGPTQAWTTPHVLRMSDGGDLTTLNPHLTQAGTTANLSELTMAWLVRWDEHNQPYPELATAIPTRANGGVSSDGMTITYHLRRGVVWSDGAPFTADDVVFSTNAVDNPSNNETTRFDAIARVEAAGKYTVVYHLKRPFATFVGALFSSCCANPCLLPKHLLGRYPNINNVAYNNLPVGIGPFVFQRWDRGKQVVLIANSRYWRGEPKLRRIVYEIIPDRDALLEAVRDHRVDLWYQFSGSYLARVAAVPDYHVVRQPSYAYNHYDFNLTHPIVSELAVRQALRLALDRRTLVSRIAHGVGVVQDSATPVSAPYYTDIGTTAYDPRRANALLDAAGWKRDGDGIREKGGRRLVLTMAATSGQPDTDKQLDLVRAGWRQIGVDLVVRHYPPALFFAPPQQGGALYGNSWDVITFAWAADPLGDFSSEYACNQFPPGGQNVLRWCNATAQHAMDAFFGHYDPAQRAADVKVLMEALDRDVPTIVTSMREDLFAYNASLKNYVPNSVTPFDNIMGVDI